jgi:hypothetical protein
VWETVINLIPFPSEPLVTCIDGSQEARGHAHDLLKK